MRIAIVGAGIGGLVAALALAQRGRAVTILERASELRAIGAGLQLSPNALDVLDRLGVATRLSASGVPADAVTLRDGRSGRVLARVPVGSRDGRGYLSLLRADLQDALVEVLRSAGDRIALRLGSEIVGLAREDRALRLDTSDASERYDLVIAADGVRSPIRRSVGGKPPRDSRAAAVRLRIPDRAAPGIEAWLGPRRHAVGYPVSAGRETNLVLVVPAREIGEVPARVFAGWDARLRALIDRGEPLGSWPLLTHHALWRAPGVAFVGDAAHAMLPYAAQGAAMAIEDGWVLASCLERETDVEAALLAYERLRAARLKRVVARVAFHRLVYHLPRPFSLGRDAVLAATPAARLRDQLGWLYDWRAVDPD